MHQTFRRGGAVLLALAALVVALALPTSAFAHETRPIAGGKYTAVVGWDVEPAFEGQKNAASIRVTRAGTDPAEPVEGLENTLKVQVRQGGEVRELPLRSVFRQPGYYVADIVPTRAGDYQLTFVGTIGDDQVNERFDTADGRFNAVEPIASLQFPVAVGGPRDTAQAVQDALATAQRAQMVGMLGVGIGALGLLAAIVALATRPRGARGVAAHQARTAS